MQRAIISVDLFPVFCGELMVTMSEVVSSEELQTLLQNDTALGLSPQARELLTANNFNIGETCHELKGRLVPGEWVVVVPAEKAAYDEESLTFMSFVIAEGRYVPTSNAVLRYLTQSQPSHPFVVHYLELRGKQELSANEKLELQASELLMLWADARRMYGLDYKNGLFAFVLDKHWIEMEAAQVLAFLRA